MFEMAKIEEIILPTLEDFNQEVKEEPPDFEAQENDVYNLISGAEKELGGDKMGEIYRISVNHWRLVCTQCFEKFETFPEFTIHIEEHLTQMFNETKFEIVELDYGDGKAGPSKRDSSERPKSTDNYQRNKRKNDLNYFDENVAPKRARTSSKARGEKTFDCTICEKKFVTAYTRVRHMLNIHKVKAKTNKYLTTSCPECNMVFSKSSNMKRHLNKIHDKAFVYKCDDCSMELKSYRDLNRHTIVIHKRKLAERLRKRGPNRLKDKNGPHEKVDKLSCPTCGETSNKLNNLKRHMLGMHSIDEIYGCKMCDTKFSYCDFLLHHLKVDHRKSGLELREKCEIVERHCVSQTEICNEKHENCPVEEKRRNWEVSFECHVCHEDLQDISLLKQHLSLHWNEFFNCQICNLSFICSFTLEQHTRSHANVNNNCDQPNCNKSFTLYKNLKRHLRVNHGVTTVSEPPLPVKKWPTSLFYCDYCGKSMRQKYYLELHMISHMPEDCRRRHTCYICGMAFTRSNNLIRHIANHDPANHKKFTCEVCNKTYRLEYKEDHMRTHTKERPYQCTVCGKTFAMSRGLDVHMACHSMERKFKCDLCPRSYTRAYKLKIHKTTHTGIYLYNCVDCQKGYPEKRSLKKHMLAYHGRPLDGEDNHSKKKNIN